MRVRYWIIFVFFAVVVGGSFWYVSACYPGQLSVWADVVTAATAVLAVCYGTYQYLSIRKVQRQEKSAEIMQMYATRIMHHMSVLYVIFQEYDEINDIIKKIDTRAELRFTKDEQTIFSITDTEARKYYNFVFNSQLSEMKRVSPRTEGDMFIDSLPRDMAKNLPDNYSLANYIAATLNELEHLCMQVESGAADSTYLYGSLHHTFLPVVHGSAMIIQKINTKSVDAENYYPYVCRLYRRWVRQQNANRKIVEKALRKSEKRQNRKARRL